MKREEKRDRQKTDSLNYGEQTDSYQKGGGWGMDEVSEGD